MHNSEKTCWNCPAALLKGNVEFRACGQSVSDIRNKISEEGLLIECARRPELGMFEPSITYEQCPEWKETDYGYMLKDMRVMILGIDGYLGWTLALKLARSRLQGKWNRQLSTEKRGCGERQQERCTNRGYED